MQQTIGKAIEIKGIGLHSGTGVTMILRPAPENHGISFIRSDLAYPNKIDALWHNVTDTRLCTLISNEAGASVGTIEHLMSALRGCQIDNLLIDINGPEVPIMDGSAAQFVTAIQAAGIVAQDAPRLMIKILSTIIVQDGDKMVRLSPAKDSIFGGEIDFDHAMVGRQSFSTELVNGNYPHLLADSRTFCFARDVELMQANGLARGGSLENAIVLGDQGDVMNPGGLRHADEFIRHKLLDAVGDLALAGAQIIGRYHGVRAGHAMNNKILHALFENRDAWMWVSENTAPAFDSVIFAAQPQQQVNAY